MSLCKVIIANSKQSFTSGSLSSLTYSIPADMEEQIAAGSFVLVPLRQQKEGALVLEILEQNAEQENFKVRDIEDILLEEQIYGKDLIELIQYTCEHYACTSSEVLAAALSQVALTKPEKLIKLLEENHDHPVVAALKKARKQQARYSRLKTVLKIKDTELKKELKKLEDKSIISSEYLRPVNKTKKSSNPFTELDQLLEKHEDIKELSEEQKNALNKINNCKIENPKFLVHGVTGSGKTELYIQCIASALEKNQSSIVLVPEISLAPQLIRRLSNRFDEDQIVIWHSALSKSEKQHNWNKIVAAKSKNQALIIVGARSAIFAPCNNLGLIVIDEEHENTYKQDSPAPRYHARELAERRAEFTDTNCRVIFGSATPSIELYHKAVSPNEEKHVLIELKKRVSASSETKIKIADMTEEFNNGNKSIFSKALKSSIETALEKEEQCLLFLNKRGLASHVFCRNCGYVYMCPNCEAKITYHADMQLMLCHHCGHKEAHPQHCPSCEQSTIKFFGLGTQKLEQETRKAFPEARIARLDSDVNREKNAYLKILNAFKNREIDILIGTQMIAKGLDFPHLSTVGVISADSNFSQLDYLAEERGFQLLTQVAGRAGRHHTDAEVIFQTYQVDRKSLQLAAKQDYQSFYQEEIKKRKELAYPPFSTLIRFIVSSENELTTIETANKFHELLYNSGIIRSNSVEALGPCAPVLGRLARKYRQHILLKILAESQEKIISKIKALYFDFKKETRNQDLSIVIDVDSISMY